MTYAKGKTTTPFGEVHVDWRLENGIITMKLVVPDGCTAHVALPQLVHGEMSEMYVDGAMVMLKEMKIATSTITSAYLSAAELTGGSYSIMFRHS